MRKVIIFLVLALSIILLLGNCSATPASETERLEQVYEAAQTNTGTFGFDSGTGVDIQRENAIQAMRYRNTAGTGTLIRLEILFDTSTPSGKVRMGVYADNQGVPGALLIDAGETEVIDGWVSIGNLNLPVTWNSYYWLAYNLQNINYVSYRDNQPVNSHYRVNDYAFGALPGTYPRNFLINNAQWVMRASVSGVSIMGDPTPTSSQTPVPKVDTAAVSGSNNIPIGNDMELFNASGWGNRVKIIIDNTRIPAPLANFPVLIRISPSSGANNTDISSIFDELGGNSKKIAIVDADRKTQCYVEIEKWDTEARQAILWAKVPQISNTRDTVLYLYFDGNQNDNNSFAGETGSKPAQNVWNNGFVSVWHFGEEGQGITGEFKDSTSKHHDGVGGAGSAVSVPSRVNSKIGDGQYFNGKNSYIEIPNNTDHSINTTGQLTISGWINPAVLNFNTPDFIRWMGKGAPGQAEYVFVIYNQNTTVPGGDGTRSNWISFYVNSPQGGLGAGGGRRVGHTLKQGEWIFFSATTDMRKSNMSFNGNPAINSELWSTYNIKYAHGTDPLRIGTDYKIENDWWNGRIDEVRISNISRSSAWIKADYFSQNDNLIKFGAPGNLIEQSSLLNQIGNQTVDAGQMLTFTIADMANEETALIYSAGNLPPGARFDNSRGQFSWVPELDQVGTYTNVHFEVSDGILNNSQDITIKVDEPAVTAAISGSTAPPTTKTEENKQPLIAILGFICIAAAFPALLIFLLRKHV